MVRSSSDSILCAFARFPEYERMADLSRMCFWPVLCPCSGLGKEGQAASEYLQRNPASFSGDGGILSASQAVYVLSVLSLSVYFPYSDDFCRLFIVGGMCGACETAWLLPERAKTFLYLEGTRGFWNFCCISGLYIVADRLSCSGGCGAHCNSGRLPRHEEKNQESAHCNSDDVFHCTSLFSGGLYGAAYYSCGNSAAGNDDHRRTAERDSAWERFGFQLLYNNPAVYSCIPVKSAWNSGRGVYQSV